MEATEKLRYGMSGHSVEAYEAELDQMWAELKDPNSDISQEAKLRRIDIAPLRALERRDAIALETEKAAFGMEVTLIIALAPLATELVKAAAPIIKDLWFKVLGPRILQSKGEDALSEQTEN